MFVHPPELMASERPHRDNVPDTDPLAFQSTYRHEIHNFLEGDRRLFRQPDQASEEKRRRHLEAVVGAAARTLVEFAKAD